MFPFGNFNELGIDDIDNFAPPLLNGPLAVKFNTIAFGDTTAKQLFTLPKGAIPVMWLTNVVTAFNSSGTDLLDIGTPAAAARFANDIDVSSVGQKLTGYVPAELFVPLTDDTIITGLYAQSVADAAAGAAYIGVLYMLS